ncbi:hypothetical protein CC2G_009755 [Coprinopsis cinerea AmutBmut pab1-1]|nr:hypothetical protein CC2G_009755 [Coprinopsis cinerea AmutBmut pab1-1]
MHGDSQHVLLPSSQDKHSETPGAMRRMPIVISELLQMKMKVPRVFQPLRSLNRLPSSVSGGTLQDQS